MKIYTDKREKSGKLSKIAFEESFSLQTEIRKIILLKGDRGYYHCFK